MILSCRIERTRRTPKYLYFCYKTTHNVLLIPEEKESVRRHYQHQDEYIQLLFLSFDVLESIMTKMKIIKSFTH